MLPVYPSHEPNVGWPDCQVPSQRAPTPRPLSHLAQSVIAFDHSPLTVYRFDLAYVLSVWRTLHEYCQEKVQSTRAQAVGIKYRRSSGLTLICWSWDISSWS